MATEFTLPELGENIETADVIKVLISPGDEVKVDQNVIEIETDKATIEVPSNIDGVVKEVKIKEGEKAKVGQVIFTVENNGEKKPEQVQQPQPERKEEEKEKSQEKKEESQPKEKIKASNVKEEVKFTTDTKTRTAFFKLPELGESIESADVLSLKVNVGDKVEKDQVILEIETDKATIEVPSDVSGIVQEIFVKAGDKAKVGQNIISFQIQEEEAGEQKKTDRIEEAGLKKAKKQIELKEPITEEEGKQKEKIEVALKEEKQREEKKPVKSKDYVSAEKKPTAPEKIAPAAPTVRRFAREIGIDINEVPGTGPGGRISIDDVKSYARRISEQTEVIPQAKGQVSIPVETLPDFSKWGEVEKKEMSNVRRKTAEHLSYSWATIPHVTQFDKADITETERLRKMYSKNAEEAGGKLTVTAILLKIIASALKTFPQFNSSVDMENMQIIYKKYYNIGIAVDTNYGLLVPVIKNVDMKNIIELSIELNQIAEKTRNKKLSLDEMQGGCFTITNLGGIGGTYFTPVINSPEVAILGVSRGSYEQVYIENKFESRLVLPLSLSYDHRVIDGADAIRFLRWVVNAVQQPFLLALEG